MTEEEVIVLETIDQLTSKPEHTGKITAGLVYAYSRITSDDHHKAALISLQEQGEISIDSATGHIARTNE